MNEPAKQRIVMVVDNTADDTCLLQLAAERACSEIHFESVLDGNEVLKILEAISRTGAPAPDFVLFDHNVPGIDGLSVWNWMQADTRLRHVPALIWSSETLPSQEPRQSSAGVPFVLKPRNMSEFRNVVSLISEMLTAGDTLEFPGPDAMDLPKLSVLLVDDHRSFCELLQVVLQTDGHTVEIADNGNDALSQLRESPFDLVITDLEMPFMKGDELATSIRHEQPDLPIILITGHGDRIGSSVEASRLFDSVLVKPFSYQTLCQTMASVVGPPFRQLSADCAGISEHK